MCSLSTCKKLRIWHALCWPFDKMLSQPRCSFQDTSSMSISQNFRNEGGNLCAHRHPRPLPQWCPRLLGVREPCRQPEGSSGQACGAGPCCLRPAGAGCWAAAHATLCSTAQHVFNMASFSLWLDWVLLFMPPGGPPYCRAASLGDFLGELAPLVYVGCTQLGQDAGQQIMQLCAAEHLVRT